MQRSRAELRRIADAVEIGPASRFVVAGEAIDLPGADAVDGSALTGLAALLYRRLYCRPPADARTGGPDSRAIRVFIDRLSEANRGRGCWQPGWIVQAIEPDDTLRVWRPPETLTVWAPRERYRPAGECVEVGVTGCLQIGKELREMLPGFYMALGDADVDDGGAGGTLMRFYWHLTAAAAPDWIAAVSGCLNDREIPFRAKVLSDPAAYTRADAGVLYTLRGHLAEVLEALPEIHRTVAQGLRRTTPLFTKPLARGLGFAEDPGGGQSFGQHRCELVADALIRTGRAGEATKRTAARAIAARFAEAGLDARLPWLNAGSEDGALWPARR